MGRKAIHIAPGPGPKSSKKVPKFVKGIYAGLVMGEKKCVEIDAQQAASWLEARQSWLFPSVTA